MIFCGHINQYKYELPHEVSVIIAQGSNDGSDQPAHPHRLSRAFTACIHEV